jgi:hypothetical protein
VKCRVKRVAVCAMATAGVFTMAILVAGRDHPERYQASDRLWLALPDAPNWSSSSITPDSAVAR